MKAKVTTLEWSLERIVRSMDKVVALAEDARQRLSSAIFRSRSWRVGAGRSATSR